MNRTILYYPTIDIPKKKWLRQAVLYWDEVSSIVPLEHVNTFSPEIEYLYKEEQFRPINPESLISNGNNWEALERFQNEFKEVIMGADFTRFRNRPTQTSGDYNIHSSKILNKNFIHRNKTSEELFYFLEGQGLASRVDNHEWLEFEHNTGFLYMSLLAKYLAETDSEHTTIGTDSVAYEKFNFKNVKKENGFPVISFDLNNILPTPKENVSIQSIVEFKRKRVDNLRHFKKLISDFQKDISEVESNVELKEKAIDFQDSLINGVQDLKAVLEDSRIENTLKTFKSLIDVKSPTLWTTASTILNSHLDYIHLPFNLSSIGIPAMAALELSTKFVEARNKRMAETRKSPFSYLYYAYKSNLIGRKI